ncbi:MAG TPA: glucose-6-phosphate dehydrogenase assembly protein OpcA [Pyrinomonadaceae bacterium]|nr:glucose-6-phosphate dehydrogenase assembly protein OpcA [Pyrinomonadaceae bacterium]
METQASTVSLSALKGIDAARLEKELTAVWAGMSGEDGGVIRACALNLVVYSEGAEEHAHVVALLDEVIERHPCRAIVLAADRDAAEPRLDAYISTRCQLSSRGAKRICGEQVTIEAGGAAVATASTAVAPLLVPDVPVFLWWRDIPHYDDRLFDRLSEMADRVVIDSAASDNPHADLLRLADVLDGRRGRLRLSDINWGRLTSWRALVAGFWDVAAYRDSLTGIERVRLDYDPPDRSPHEVAPKALLAVGWLATSLGWEPEDGKVNDDEGGASFKLNAGGRTVEVSLAPTEDAAGRDGMLTSLLIETAAGDEFCVRLRAGESKLETGARTAGGHAVGRVLGYELRSEGQRLSAELEILTRDRVYERSVAFAARMLRSAGV